MAGGQFEGSSRTDLAANFETMAESGSPRKPILSDHQKVGSTFIAPFSRLNLTETSWVDRLPDLIWMGLLNDACGYKRGVELASEFAKAAYEISPGEKKRNYGEASAFKALSAGEREKLLATAIVQAARQELQIALESLNTLYPESPLSFLGLPQRPSDRTKLTSMMNRVVDDNLDKREKSAMFLQANLVYIGGICGIVHFSTVVEPPNLNALGDYPDTEESKRAASSVRALALAFGQNSGISDWSKYFWNQGLAIEACRTAVTKDG